MKTLIKKAFRSLQKSPLSYPLAKLYQAAVLVEYAVCCPFWRLRGRKLETAESPGYRQKVVDEVTFIFKSFERQGMAKRLYRSIQRYYPGVRIIIADDSRKPLKLDGPEIIQFPFNSGLSKGIQACLDRVQTPYTIHMDDDMLLTPLTRWEDELRFHEQHPEFDLCAVQGRTPRLSSPRDIAAPYFSITMDTARQPQRFPVGLSLDAHHYTAAKTPNYFLVRTEAYRQVGYDENIRMIDHHEFFFRAAGVLACTMNVDAFLYHYHNRFSPGYDKYRNDWKGDARYIRMKHKKY